MKISICNYDNNDEVYTEFEDASSAQVSAYIGAEVISFNGLELFKETVVMDVLSNTLYVLVSEAQVETERQD